MAVQQAVRIVCDGCGAESEWRPEERHRWGDEETVFLRDRLKRLGWKHVFDGPRAPGKDFCPLCTRCEKQGGRLVDEAVQKGGV